MKETEIEWVLEFLRKNGLSLSESALIDEIIQKSRQGSSDFEKFLFPMVPPPPPLRIPSTRSLTLVGDGGGESSKDSSDDEFVSLVSSTTDLCSSEFTNPYGIRTTRPTSQASSDRLSQFGTARDYPDFDMQNDLFWYKEKDEDYVMPPLFDDQDFEGDPSEDKYITTVQIADLPADRFTSKFTSARSNNHVANGWHLTSSKSLKNEAQNDYDELDEMFRIEKNDKRCNEHCYDYSCSAPCDVFYSAVERVNSDNLAEHSLIKLKLTDECDSKLSSLEETHLTSDMNASSKGSSAYDSAANFSDTLRFNCVEKDGQSYGKGNFEYIDNGEISGGPLEPKASAEEDEGAGATPDELLMYENSEGDYEIFELRIIHRKNRTGFEENKDLPIVLNSIMAGRYYVTEFLGSAAFSKVIQAHDLCSGMDVCLKIIKNDKDFFDQSLDEIKLLKFVNKHDPADDHHILRLYDYFYHQEHLFIVTELLRANLYEFQKYNRESGGDHYFTMHRLQVITRQCLEAVSFLHDLGIIHCDLKPENILIKSYRRCEIKVIDLGSSCFQADNLSLYVQSRSYRAPEVMLGLPYDQKIDLWSIGCILAELCTGEVLFPNEAVVMLLARMIGLLGPIDPSMLQKGQETHKYFTEEFDLYHLNEETNQLEYIIPEEPSLEDQLQISDSGLIDFLKFLLQINPKKRPTAREALQHPWFSHPYQVS